MKKLAIGVLAVLGVAGCYDNWDGLNEQVQALTEWAGPDATVDADTITVNQTLENLVKAVTKAQNFCNTLKGYSVTYPEFASLDCEFFPGGTGGGGDDSPSGKPPAWP